MIASPAQAQRVNTKANEHSKWYNAPRELQIIDDRPIVHDFREAAEAPQYIDLPPGPVSQPGYRSGGAGALPGDGGATLPSGGLPVSGGGGEPGYRMARDNNPVPLEKSDFGTHRHSNIQNNTARALPPGVWSGVHGTVAAPKYQNPQIASAAPTVRKAAPAQTGPTRSLSYSPSGDYGASVGSGSGRSGASTAVMGRLLKQVK